MQFYQSVFGGELTVSTFGEVPGMPGVDESEANEVMHSTLEAPNGFTLMAPTRRPRWTTTRQSG